MTDYPWRDKWAWNDQAKKWWIVTGIGYVWAEVTDHTWRTIDMVDGKGRFFYSCNSAEEGKRLATARLDDIFKELQ